MFQTLPRGIKENHKNKLRGVGVPVEIQTRNLTNRRHENYFFELLNEYLHQQGKWCVGCISAPNLLIADNLSNPTSVSENYKVNATP